MGERCKSAAGAAMVLVVALASGAASAQTKPPPNAPTTPMPVITDENARGMRILPAEAEAPPPAPPPPAPPPPAPPPRASGPPVPVVQLCSRPVAQPDLTFAEGRAFDRALARKLKAGGVVTIDLPQPYAEKGEAPGTLSNWLAQVQAGGGAVTVKQYCEAARGSLTDWVAGLFTPKPGGVYRPARAYDAVLHTDALDHVITQIEFTPRAAKTGA